MASRRVNAFLVAKQNSENTKRRVLNCVTGKFKYEYIKPNWQWNVTKIAKDSGTSRPTVMKYLKEEKLWWDKWC